MSKDTKHTTPRNEREATEELAAPHARIRAGDERLAYWRFGSGPDVVLVHGWPLHAATFRRIVPMLARRFTLHVFDLPGVGHSRAVGPVGFEEHARTVRLAIDALGLTRYALLAHDSGGVVARLVAADDPRVTGMILGGTEIPGHRPIVFPTYVRLARWPGFKTFFLMALRVGAYRRSKLGFGTCFSDPRYVHGSFDELFIRPLLDSPRLADGQLAMLRSVDFAFVDTMTAGAHARTRIPVLGIWGSDDPFFPVDRARLMMSEFGGEATLVTIEGAKLFAHEDHPEAFAAHALPFLERVLHGAGAPASIHDAMNGASRASKGPPSGMRPPSIPPSPSTLR